LKAQKGELMDKLIDTFCDLDNFCNKFLPVWSYDHVNDVLLHYKLLRHNTVNTNLYLHGVFVMTIYTINTCSKHLPLFCHLHGN